MLQKSERNVRQGRSTNAVVVVYLSKAQKAALDRAAKKLVEDVPGARFAVSTFMLGAAIEKAKGMGIKPHASDAHDYFVVTPHGNFGFDDIAHRGSMLPRWEIREGGHVIGIVDVHLHEQYAEPREPIVALAMRAFEKEYGKEIVAKRPSR